MKIAVIGLLSLMSGLAHAGVKEQVATIEKSLDACLADKDNYSTAGMIQCSSDAFELVDAILNKVYREKTVELREGNDPDSTEILRRLVAAQRAWITYRDANVELMGTSMLGGSGEGVVRVGTMFKMTKERVLELDDLFAQR